MTFNTCERNLVISSSLSEHSRVLKLKRFFLLFRCLEDVNCRRWTTQMGWKKMTMLMKKKCDKHDKLRHSFECDEDDDVDASRRKMMREKRSWKSSRYARWIRNIFALDFAISALTCKWFICKQFLVRWHLVIFFLCSLDGWRISNLFYWRHWMRWKIIKK